MPEPQDIAALRETAEKATPGPWRHTERGIEGGEYDDVIVGGPVSCMAYCYGGSSTLDGDRIDMDGDFIAATSPDVVLALLSEVERGRALRAAVEALAERGELEIASLIRSAALIQPFGPNSRAVHDAGGAVHLTPAEAEAGARAVLDHLATLIAAHVPSPLLDGGAGEGDR